MASAQSSNHLSLDPTDSAQELALLLHSFQETVAPTLLELETTSLELTSVAADPRATALHHPKRWATLSRSIQSLVPRVTELLELAHDLLLLAPPTSPAAVQVSTAMEHVSGVWAAVSDLYSSTHPLIQGFSPKPLVELEEGPCSVPSGPSVESEIHALDQDVTRALGTTAVPLGLVRALSTRLEAAQRRLDLEGPEEARARSSLEARLRSIHTALHSSRDAAIRRRDTFDAVAAQLAELLATLDRVTERCLLAIQAIPSPDHHRRPDASPPSVHRAELQAKRKHYTPAVEKLLQLLAENVMQETGVGAEADSEAEAEEDWGGMRRYVEVESRWERIQERMWEVDSLYEASLSSLPPARPRRESEADAEVAILSGEAALRATTPGRGLAPPNGQRSGLRAPSPVPKHGWSGSPGSSVLGTGAPPPPAKRSVSRNGPPAPSNGYAHRGGARPDHLAGGLRRSVSSMSMRQRPLSPSLLPRPSSPSPSMLLRPSSPSMLPRPTSPSMLPRPTTRPLSIHVQTPSRSPSPNTASPSLHHGRRQPSSPRSPRSPSTPTHQIRGAVSPRLSPIHAPSPKAPPPHYPDPDQGQEFSLAHETAPHLPRRYDLDALDPPFPEQGQGQGQGHEHAHPISPAVPTPPEVEPPSLATRQRPRLVARPGSALAQRELQRSSSSLGIRPTDPPKAQSQQHLGVYAQGDGPRRSYISPQQQLLQQQAYQHSLLSAPSRPASAAGVRPTSSMGFRRAPSGPIPTSSLQQRMLPPGRPSSAMDKRHFYDGDEGYDPPPPPAKHTAPAPAGRRRSSATSSPRYRPDKADPLDVRVGALVNASPLEVDVKRVGKGKYAFGGKVWFCKVDIGRSRDIVSVRVGGGWKELETLLLEVAIGSD